MAVSSSTAGLAVSIINGVIKLGIRIDRLIAEKKAGHDDMALPVGAITIATPAVVLLAELTTLAKTTRGAVPDPLGEDRTKIEDLIERASPPDDQVFFFLERHKPDAIKVEVLDPDKYVLAELQRLGVDEALDQEEIKRLAFYVGPGQNVAGSKLAWRIVMVTVDVLAEFTVENQNRIVRDPQIQKVVTAVLTRFSSGDLEEDVASPHQLLRRALSSTLNGVIDAREVWDGDNPWLDAFLSALADARERAEVKDEFLIGLFQGRGYRTLIQELLEEGSEHLSAEDSDAYKKILADILEQAAVKVGDVDGFGEFFQDHWTDLARAGLRAFGSHGSAILKGTDPILRETLIAAVVSLSDPNNREFFSSDSLMAATEAAIAAVAAKPELLEDGSPWAGVLFGSFAGLVADEGLRKTFTVEGLEGFVRRTLVSVSENPELIIDEPGLPRVVVASILKQIATAVDMNGDSRIEALATRAVDGALTAISENPNLVGTKYPEVLAEVAGAFARHVRERSITGIVAVDIVEVLAGTIAARPELLGTEDDRTLLKTFGLSLAEVIAEQNLRAVFSTAGLESLVKETLVAVGEHPELIFKKPGLPREVVGSMLVKIAEAIPASGDLRLEAVASAAVDGVLTAVGENPQLLDTDYAEVLADLASGIALKVRAGSIGQIQAEELMAALADAVADNPELFTTLQKDLARQVVERVTAAAEEDPKKLLAGAGLAEVLASTVSVLAARGVKLLGDGDAAALADTLAQVIEGALDVAAAELGRRLDRSSIPLALAVVVERWSRDDLPDPVTETAAFVEAFAGIADWAQRSRERSVE